MDYALIPSVLKNFGHREWAALSVTDKWETGYKYLIQVFQ